MKIRETYLTPDITEQEILMESGVAASIDAEQGITIGNEFGENEQHNNFEWQ